MLRRSSYEHYLINQNIIERLEMDPCTVSDTVTGSSVDPPYTRHTIKINGVSERRLRRNERIIRELEVRCAEVDEDIACMEDSRLAKILLMRYDLEYEDQWDDAPAPVHDIAIVYSEDGNPVRMRKAHTTASETIVKVPKGAQVEVTESADGWSTILWNGKRGYMMTDFLRVIGMTPVEPEAAPADGYTITLSASAAAELLSALRKAGVVW